MSIDQAELLELIRAIVEDVVYGTDPSLAIQDLDTRLHRIEQQQEMMIEGTASGLNWIVKNMKKEKRHD